MSKRKSSAINTNASINAIMRFTKMPALMDVKAEPKHPKVFDSEDLLSALSEFLTPQNIAMARRTSKSLSKMPSPCEVAAKSDAECKRRDVFQKCPHQCSSFYLTLLKSNPNLIEILKMFLNPNLPRTYRWPDIPPHRRDYSENDDWGLEGRNNQLPVVCAFGSSFIDAHTFGPRYYISEHSFDGPLDEPPPDEPVKRKDIIRKLSRSNKQVRFPLNAYLGIPMRKNLLVRNKWALAMASSDQTTRPSIEIPGRDQSYTGVAVSYENDIVWFEFKIEDVWETAVERTLRAMSLQSD